MLDLETVIKAGAVLPSNKALEAAIIWAIQFEKCHLRSEIFQKILFFINRVELNQGQPAKYLPTWEQYQSVIDSLIEQEILVDKSGELFHHPQIQQLIDSDQPKPHRQKKKKWRK